MKIIISLGNNNEQDMSSSVTLPEPRTKGIAQIDEFEFRISGLFYYYATSVDVKVVDGREYYRETREQVFYDIDEEFDKSREDFECVDYDFLVPFGLPIIKFWKNTRFSNVNKPVNMCYEYTSVEHINIFCNLYVNFIFEKHLDYDIAAGKTGYKSTFFEVVVHRYFGNSCLQFLIEPHIAIAQFDMSRIEIANYGHFHRDHPAFKKYVDYKKITDKHKMSILLDIARYRNKFNNENDNDYATN